MSVVRVCPLLALLVLGCPPAISDPPPPPRKAEILPAPPRALGAHAAGTDAAPKPEIVAPGVDPAPEAAPGGGAGAPAAATPPGAGTAL